MKDMVLSEVEVPLLKRGHKRAILEDRHYDIISEEP